LLEGVVSSSGGKLEIAGDPTRVSQEMPRRDGGGILRPQQTELRKLLDQWPVEIDFALADKLHDQRRRVELGDRGDPEQRARRDGDAAELVGDAADQLVDILPVENAHRDPRNAVDAGGLG